MKIRLLLGIVGVLVMLALMAGPLSETVGIFMYMAVYIGGFVIALFAIIYAFGGNGLVGHFIGEETDESK